MKKKKISALKSNFKVQDTTKSVKQKGCEMILLNVPNFLYIYRKPLFKKNVGFLENIEKITYLLHFNHPKSDFTEISKKTF